MTQKPNHVYYNMTITNNTTQPILAQKTDFRNVSIVDKIEDYELSIIKFSIPTSQLPIIQNFPTGATGISQNTGLSITIVRGASISQRFLIYVPIDTSGQSYIYSYKTIIDMINSALSLAWTDIAGVGNAPYMSFDSSSQLFSIFYSNLNLGNFVYIWFNSNLAYYFPSFPFTYYNTVPFAIANNGLYARLPNDDQHSPNEVNPLPTGMFQVLQEYPSTISLYTPRSLRIVCGTIPTRAEMIPVSIPSGQLVPENIQSSSNNDNTQKILTDFDLPLNNAIADLRPFITFTQVAPYRRIDIISQGELRIFSLQIFWVDAYNNLYELYFDPNQSVTMKFMFERKLFN